MRIKSELDAVSDQGQILIKRYGNLSEFLIYDENITIVDEYICLNGDTETARNLALSQVMEKVQPFNESSQDQGDPQITNLTVAPTNRSTFGPKPNVWNTKQPPPMTNSSSTGLIEPMLNLPEVNSLFDYKTATTRVNPIQPPKTSVISIPTSFPIPPPPLNVSDCNGPPSLIKHNGFNSVGLGGTGGTIGHEMELNNEEKSLSNRLHGLLYSNVDLLKIVAAQEKEIKEMKGRMPKPDEEKRCEKLVSEIKVLKEQVATLKAEKLEEAQLAGKRHLAIQKQLDQERATSRTTQLILENERISAGKLAVKYHNLEKYGTLAGMNIGTSYQPTNTNPTMINSSISSSINSSMSSSVAVVPSLPGSTANTRVNSMDTLGLRSIWNSPNKQTTTSIPSSTTNRSDLRQNFSSSAGSVMLSKPPPPRPTASLSSPLFPASPFDYGGDYGGLFNPMSVITTTSTSSSTTNSSSSPGSGSFGSYPKCL